ncbi:DUF488 family protein [Lachnospiraceae bacterium 38-10]
MTINRSLPTYKRQRFLLDFVKQLSADATTTDLQKLIFLHTKSGYSSYYDFIPYRYGPYSFQLAEDISILLQNEFLIKKDARIYAKDSQVNENINNIDIKRGDLLIKKVYKNYPYYAINSEIVDRLFSSTELEKIKNGKNQLKQTMQVLFTIGYEGQSLETFINKLIKNDIRLLCDVRKNPLSRKFGFSKSKLQHILGTIGIQYVHIPELGIESQKRVNLKSISDYQQLFQEYETSLSKRQKYLDYVHLLLSNNIRIVLLCYEKEPEMCHRHVIRDYIMEKYNIRSQDL